MLLTIGIVLVCFWILGLVLRMARGVIHLVLLVGIVLLVLHFLRH